MKTLDFKQIIVMFLTSIMLYSCYGKEPISCEDVFKTVGINVIGPALTDYYTVRISTNDTLRFNSSGWSPNDNYYLVLDDTYTTALRNNHDNFRFIGKVHDTIKVNEIFFIKADECHIEQLSGKSTVEIQ